MYRFWAIGVYVNVGPLWSGRSKIFVGQSE